MTTATPIRCAEAVSYTDQACAPQPGYLPRICCASCHEDEDLGYPLAAVTIDSQPADICCAVLRHLEGRNLIT